MIHSIPTHYAYCDLCMRKADGCANTVPELLDCIASEGWRFEEGKEYCQDVIICAECCGSANKTPRS